MAMTLAFSEPATVNTGGAVLAAGSVYDTGHGVWVYLGFRSPGNVACVQTSPDRTTWTMHNMPSASTWRAIAYAPTLQTNGRLVAVGNGVAAKSDDGGATWSAAGTLPEANNWADVTWWTAQGMFVAVSTNGTNRVMTSTDGDTWVAQAAAAAKGWSGVICSDTVAVAVTRNTSTSTQQVMTSADGAAWSLQTHADIKTDKGTVSSGQRVGIGYSPDLDMFLITGTLNATGVTYAYRSTDDGVTWTASNVVPTISDTTNRGYTWSAAAQSWYMSCANANYGESTDGITFTVTALSLVSGHNGWTPMGYDDASASWLGGSTLGFDSVLVVDLVSLGALSPTTGTKRGGTVVTITGTGLSGVAQGDVLFDASAALSVSAAADGRTVTCITPAHAVGEVTVTITGIGTL